MPLLYPFVIFLLLLILANLVRGPDRSGHVASRKDEEIAQLRDRVAALERVVLEKDWDLRRKFDGL
ncbi:MAG: hypothetical protein R3C08_02230 [Hyphomonas sp.]